MTMQNLAIFKSRKATMAVISAAMSYLCIKSGFSVEQTLMVIAPLAAYIPIEGAADYKRVNLAQAQQAQQPQPQQPQ